MPNCLVSIIIPVFNDPKGLKSTIDSLLKQTYDKNFIEIIIADNGSYIENKQVAQDFQSVNPNLIKVVHEDEIQEFSFRLRDTLKVKVQAEVPHDWQTELDEVARELNVKKLELYRFIYGEFLGKVREIKKS